MVLRLHIRVALQQQTAGFKVALPNAAMQWSFLTEEKQKNQLAQTEFHLLQKIRKKGRERLQSVLCLHIRVALQQKTADFKVATASRGMQWSPITEGKQKNQQS